MASWALNPCHVKNKLPVLQGEGEQRPKTGSSWSFSFIEPKWTKTSDLKLGRWVLWDRNGLLASYLHFLQHHANLSRSNQELPLVKYNDNGNEGKTNIPPDITEDKGEIWRSKVSLCNLLDVEKWSWQQARKHKCNFQTFLLWEKKQPRFVLNTNFTILHSIMTCASLKQAQFEAPATKAISYRLTQQLQLTGWGWWSRESRFWTDLSPFPPVEGNSWANTAGATTAYRACRGDEYSVMNLQPYHESYMTAAEGGSWSLAFVIPGWD